jgi:hypothetical protein
MPATGVVASATVVSAATLVAPEGFAAGVATGGAGGVGWAAAGGVGTGTWAGAGWTAAGGAGTGAVSAGRIGV